MRLVLLGGVPSINRGTSACFVLAHFAKALSQSGENVSIIVEDKSKVTVETEKFLTKYGVSLASFPRHKIVDVHNLSNILKKIFIIFGVGLPRVSNRKNLVNFLKSFRAEHYILFVDSSYQILINDMVKNKIKLSAYLSNSPYSAELYNVNLMKGSLKKTIALRYWERQEKKYNLRLTKLSLITPLNAIHAKELASINPNTCYLSNTWPDRYPNEWRQTKLELFNSFDGHTRVLLNMGGVNQTGNLIARQYFIQSIIPSMVEKRLESFEFNICGGGTINNKDIEEFKKLQKLSTNTVNIKGFVGNIDKEIMQNHLFLLLNNINSHYNASYTRVIQCASLGSTLIAHHNLSLTIPELKHKFNCLLFNDIDELQTILMNFAVHVDDYFKLGENLRKTYETHFQPRVIAEKFVSLLRESSKR